MKKTFPVVMLPTEKASKLYYSDNNTDLLLSKEPISFRTFERSPQHLYIISDDEIKEGDWYINGEFINQAKSNIPYTKYIKGKIVATTDKSLKVTDLISDKYAIYIPQIPESFIQAYIKSYNEGKPITEVDLEMEEFTDGNGMFRSKRLFQPRTRPDNTVIIHQSKMYTREEVIAFAKKYAARCQAPIQSTKWINENL